MTPTCVSLLLRGFNCVPHSLNTLLADFVEHFKDFIPETIRTITINSGNKYNQIY